MSDNTQKQDQKQDENRLIAERREKLNALREAGNAFPNSFRRDSYAQDLLEQFGEKTKEELEEAAHTVSIAGRVVLNRGAFGVIQDMTGRIQFYVNKAARPFAKSLDLGDIIGVTGVLHKSGKGDLYVDLGEYQLLTKSLRPLPDKHKGLQDTEIRYRQRYVDLITNEQSRKVFEARSKIVSGIRNYLTERRFIEAETPMLQVIPGGAAARPFITHHNALDRDMYLRIAPELYLKRLVVGGFERVFEINRNFRNEGLSTRHNPEFTMIEFYQAYADYHDLMDLTEDMLRTVAQNVLGTTTIVNTVRNEEGEILETFRYDLSKSFTRLSVFDSVLQYNPEITAEALADDNAARQIAERMDIDVKDGWGLGRVQIEIFEKTVEHRLQQPTFITEYPTEVSPLARRNDDNPFVTDRFEFFVAGRELANGFSELNDSEDQAERFRAQVAEMEAGDDEAMHYDDDYINALEYGLPPTAGEGIGVDRLVMLFTDSASIRDVILFPAMRPRA
ncbi:lysine--tRNA ligase [Neptunomonas qingdaonensis]|uniref:Lysine--tRNA ligase n=1 Tax=Neptunomonas qingdaonensis TaxID=1045558 RepID=A0A1I2U9Q3_9GAMM|nr:lysine--tRNA ligase [Neptunomonas qingdaonensis]SFG73828.1 lysyl-tRNA synthetase, class 2 [Neptunomonas qingdaonensis]